MYYLYKLFLNGTPKYYVGITNDPVRREMGHKSAINTAIKDIKAGTWLLRSDYRMTIARHILATEKRKYRHEAFFHVSFKVIVAKIPTLEEARATENRYLSRRGKHCLNKIGKSYYNSAEAKYSESYMWLCSQMSKQK